MKKNGRILLLNKQLKDAGAVNEELIEENHAENIR